MGIDFTLLLPEFMLAALAFLVLGLDLALPARWEAKRNGLTGAAAALGMLGILLFAVFDLRDTQEVLYGGIYFVDRFSLLFKVVFLGASIAVVLMSIDYVGRKMRHPGEYYAMIVFSALGAVMMSASGELLTAYVALELLAFSLYVLVGLTRGDGRTAEASAKYILLGALSSAVLLFGIALLYGTLGGTVFREMAGPLSQSGTATTALGFTMVAAGLGFKLAAVPFHMWTPDVYEGAPTPVTAHLSVLSKAATFALVLRFLAEAAGSSFMSWQLALAILAALTMIVGTLVALAQTNIKRLFAYSSIAQVGFVLAGGGPVWWGGGGHRGAGGGGGLALWGGGGPRGAGGGGGGHGAGAPVTDAGGAPVVSR
ncbi:MAG: NADH-quinone oxidoreductase subunit N, partial [Chloroflexota bacterium]|nr:NADH-quinone oxidoreductase subunit N [Chloroflexota bacterium]